MKKYNVYPLLCLALLLVAGWIFPTVRAGTGKALPAFYAFLPDTNYRGDTTLRYPFNEETVLPGSGNESPIYLNNPSNIKSVVEYDPVTRQYYNTYKIGETVYRIPTTLSFDEFQNQDMQSMINQYWKERSEA
ncbi:MAG TPA: hypothetical protein PLK82_01490, partial [Bacteroidales bacterium]|nr:hypothetical protein [Bacteroidales bacterium]